MLLLTAGEHRHSLRQEIPAHDLVVTNYALLRRDLAALQKFSFRAIILDEAQNIKNPESMVARAAKALKAEHKLALTGTPLENRLLDLWSIMEFVHPGYLPDRGKFLEQYDRGASQPARALLSSRMRPVMLRRLKKQVAQDLPDRIEERIDCELTEGQRKFYLAELQRSRQALSTLDMQAGPVAHARARRAHPPAPDLLPSLARRRQEGPRLRQDRRRSSSCSSRSTPAGHKVLVFSQFVEMLKILKTELEERGRPYFMLTGQTTQRGEVVQAFHDCKEPAVFLLSLKAAGTGLNLTSASYVVLYDPWWNPAVEAQAIDRTHRIGQDRTVIAYRLVTQGTVEEKIWRLQQSKAQLAQDVLGEEGFTGSLSQDRLRLSPRRYVGGVGADGRIGMRRYDVSLTEKHEVMISCKGYESSDAMTEAHCTILAIDALTSCKSFPEFHRQQSFLPDAVPTLPVCDFMLLRQSSATPTKSC